MELLHLVANEITYFINEYEDWLLEIPEQVVYGRKNQQNRSIKQIVGHMIDSASNNTHRIIHLQYQKSPISFPDYVNHGNNDRWIAIQNYQEEDWSQLIQLWKYTHLHLCHVIRQINPAMKPQIWISGNDEHIRLDTMVTDFPRHFKLHIEEIRELAKS